MVSSKHVVAAIFADEQAARDALAHLKDAQRSALLCVDNAAVIRREADGSLRLRARATAHGATVGGLLGAALSLIGGEDDWAGALLGSEAAHLAELGLAAPEVAALSDFLSPSAAAVVAVAGHEWLREVRGLMTGMGAAVHQAELPAELAQALPGAQKPDTGKQDALEVEGVAIDEGGAVYAAPAGPQVESVYDHAHVYFDYSDGGAGELFAGE